MLDKSGRFRESNDGSDKGRIIQLRDEDGKGVDLAQYEEVIQPVYMDIPRRLESVREFKYAPGDVFVCSYPKSVLFGSFWSYVDSWQAVIKQKHRNILLIYYEDLVQDCFKELKKLQAFLGLERSDVILREIERRCSFQGLQRALSSGQMENTLLDVTGKNILLRKGTIGDWKSHFTREQSEVFDKFCQEKLQDSIFRFQYEGGPAQAKL